LRAHLAALTVAFLIGTLSLASADGIPWLSSLDEGLQAARGQDKLVMVDFYSDLCDWCKELDRLVYTEPMVQDASREHFVPVKLDGGRHDDLVTKYDLDGYPTVIFLDAQGEEISRIRGFEPADLFLADMMDAVELKALKSEAVDLEKAVKAGEGGFEAYARLGHIYRRLGKTELARTYLTKAHETGQTSPDFALDWILGTEKASPAVEALDKWIKANPEHSRRWEAGYELGMAKARLRQWEGSVDVFRGVAKGAGDSAWAARSRFVASIIEERYLKPAEDCRT